MTGLAALLNLVAPPPESRRTDRLPETRGLGRGVNIGMGSQQQGMMGAFDAYGNVGTVFSAVSREAEAVAQVNWNWSMPGPSKDAERLMIDPDAHPLAHLWDWINPWSDNDDFIETIVQHFILVGETDWLPVYNRPTDPYPAELWPIRPNMLEVIPDPVNHIAGWKYRNGAEMIPLFPDQIIQMKRPNPRDPWRGLGVTQALLADIQGERAASEWQRNFFWNGAAPGGVIEFDERLSDPEYEEIGLRLREQHQGVANANRVMLLERGHWADRKFTQRDMQFVDYRKLERDQILLAFGMPLAILGGSESVNRANAFAAETLFARWIVRSIADRIKSTVNRKLVPAHGLVTDRGLQVGYVDPVPEDRELLAKIGMDGWMAGGLKYWEFRKSLGYETDAKDPDRDSKYQGPPQQARPEPLEKPFETPPGAALMPLRPQGRTIQRIERDAAGRISSVTEETEELEMVAVNGRIASEDDDE